MLRVSGLLSRMFGRQEPIARIRRAVARSDGEGDANRRSIYISQHQVPVAFLRLRSAEHDRRQSVAALPLGAPAQSLAC
jgi:hypothetical protein